MAEEWKEKIIREKLDGKKDWTEEERAELCQQLDEDLDRHIDSMSKTKYEGGWTEENWKEVGTMIYILYNLPVQLMDNLPVQLMVHLNNFCFVYSVNFIFCFEIDI